MGRPNPWTTLRMSWGVHVLVRWDGMGWVCKLVGWVKKKWPMSTSEPTQLPSLGGTRNEYWPSASMLCG